MAKKYYDEIPKTIADVIGRLQQESRYPYIVVADTGYVGGTYADVSALLSGGGKRFIFRGPDVREGIAQNIIPGTSTLFTSLEECAKAILK